MFSTTDTIVAIATPPGRGAIGVVRLSGPESQRVAAELLDREKPLEPRRATYARLTAGALRDQVIVTLFAQPASYTGEDVVEISAHGSAVVLNAILARAVECGARLAAPGEFTLRAYLNAKLDLPQAEAVADLIDAVTPLQARAAFDQLNGTLTSAITPIEAELFDLAARLEASVDFPDEGYHFIEPTSVARALEHIVAQIDRLLGSARRGRLVREGVQVAIVGKPNVGKSSLFNALVGAHRAIVTDIAGTTRDLVTEVVDLGGLRVTLVDTAGITESDNPVEREGVSRARQALNVADVILLVHDGTQPWDDGDIASQVEAKKTLIVSSKADLPAVWEREHAVRVSAMTGLGLNRLITQIHRLLGEERFADTPAVSNVRHIDLLERARTALINAAGALDTAGGALSEEFVLADIQQARQCLEEVTGRRTSDDLLVYVFQRFCVGK